MNLKEIMEGPGNALTKYELGQMRRNELPSILRDQVRNGVGSDGVPGSKGLMLILTPEIALAIAQDLDLAIAKSPGLSYGS
jgi:hypothetical protein